jgi:L-fucose isomerase-like protein
MAIISARSLTGGAVAFAAVLGALSAVAALPARGLQALAPVDRADRDLATRYLADLDCYRALRATVDATEGEDVPLADAGADAYEVVECQSAVGGEG